MPRTTDRSAKDFYSERTVVRGPVGGLRATAMSLHRLGV